jgi:hypothetical protein
MGYFLIATICGNFNIATSPHDSLKSVRIYKM